jgi:recombination protein RecA
MSKKSNKESNVQDELSDFLTKELGSSSEDKVEKFISTGSTLLDYAIANRTDGGIPVGRITEICGNEGSGKSLIAYHIMANTQKMGGIAVYIDTERAYNQAFMERMGVNTKSRFVIPSKEKMPKTIEEVFDYIEDCVIKTSLKMPKKDVPVTIVWDSVAATIGKEEIENAHADTPRMGTEARAMSRSLRKAIHALDTGYVTLVCINQLREKIGVSFGDPDVTSHGKALPFYASVRVKLKSMKQIKDTQSGRTIGVATQAKVFKNKVGPNHRAVDFPLYFDWGVNDEVSWLDYLKDLEVVKTTGPWSTLSVGGEDLKFQGTQGWVDVLKNDKAKEFVLDKIEESMVIKFDRRPESIAIDPDSILEVEQLKSDLEQHGANR